MLLNTLSAPFKKGRSVNCTDTAFDSVIPAAGEPEGGGDSASARIVFNLSQRSDADSVGENSVLIVPFGAGTEDTTFAMRVIGWRRVGVNVNTDLWIPVVLGEFTCTLSGTVGVAGMEVVETDRFVDTLAIVTGNSGISCEIVSPTGDEIAHVVLALKGFQKWEVSFDMTGATSGNFLYAYL